MAGVLGSRGFALESAVARVCREAGGRVSANVRVQDMDLAAPNPLDNRRIEVVVDGLPLFHGAQVAVDTTLVSPLRRDGTPHPRCANVDGAALDTARRRKESTYRELHGRNGRTRLADESAQFVRQLAKAKSERGASNPPQSGPTGVDTQVVFHPGLQRCQVFRIVVAGASGRPWRGRATHSTSEVIGDARHLCANFRGSVFVT